MQILSFNGYKAKRQGTRPPPPPAKKVWGGGAKRIPPNPSPQKRKAVKE